MSAIEVGRICIKTLGREAGNTCVVVEVLDANFAVIDGNVKRRRCNLKHIEPTEKTVELEKGASTEEVKLALDAAGLL
ncbi:50S ribosomal protein L14e [Methanococcus voltae]|jgi:large subunit ribosomal protein L14e|uniref:Large ribosomal subunit protein eL14 n=1 Tax=Methanococcus voltae (strain ATCC BAA-1334 / A3) TaxID=456320 RepID=D7DT62_METV3|nr:50S ribosomal protein L14e [Methanococcus voltae]MCS3901822.1 large subunit ribosomal protein L14e [Methanococcus voltae]